MDKWPSRSASADAREYMSSVCKTRGSASIWTPAVACRASDWSGRSRNGSEGASVWSELRERVAQYDSRTSDMRLRGGGVSPSVDRSPSAAAQSVDVGVPRSLPQVGSSTWRTGSRRSTIERSSPLTFRRFGHAINTNEVFGAHTPTQIREPHHANLTLNVSDSQKRGSRVLRQRKGATITAIFDKRAAADALKGRGELLLAQADALRPSAADD